MNLWGTAAGARTGGLAAGGALRVAVRATEAAGEEADVVHAACRDACGGIVRRCDQGWPAGCTWSRVVVPIVWASAGRGSLHTLRWWSAVAETAQALRQALRARGVSDAGALRAWLRDQGHATRPSDFGYMSAATQEWLLATTGVGQTLQAAVINAVRQHAGRSEAVWAVAASTL